MSVRLKVFGKKLIFSALIQDKSLNILVKTQPNNKNLVFNSLSVRVSVGLKKNKNELEVVNSCFLFPLLSLFLFTFFVFLIISAYLLKWILLSLFEL